VVGTFRNGRIESFLELTSLGPDDIGKDMYKYDIAKTLARFHLISQAWEPPTTLPTPFERVKEWLHTAKTLDFSDNEGHIKLLEKINIDAVLGEVDMLSGVASQLNSPPVYAHNDLLSGNIMVDVKEGRVQDMTFIDFEYADWAPRGFDLGNHFCEYAGFDGDYSKYPEQADGFIKAYLEVYRGVPVRMLCLSRISRF
jgi:ethanolamine kinase